MDRALSLQELGTVPFQGVVSKKHSGKALRSLPFVGSRPEDYARGVAPVHARLKEKGHSGDAFFACNVHEVQKRLVQEGLGFSVFPRLMVEEELKRGSLVAIPALTWHQPVYLALRVRRALSPAAEFARAWFEKHGL
jgi:DNA-binding transcriptional LysR family regulator